MQLPLLCYPHLQILVNSVQFSSVAQSCLTLRPHESQHARPPCPSPTPGVYPNSCPSSQWCHPAISSSVVPFSSWPQSLPASGSFSMSQLFPWGGQLIRPQIWFLSPQLSQTILFLSAPQSEKCFQAENQGNQEAQSVLWSSFTASQLQICSLDAGALTVQLLYFLLSGVTAECYLLFHV